MKFKYDKVLRFILVISLIIIFSGLVLAAASDFVDELTDSYHNQPYYVTKDSLRKYEIIPAAQPPGDSDDYIYIYFRSLQDAPNSANIKLEELDGSDVSGWTGDETGPSSGDISWERLDAKHIRVILDRTQMRDLLTIGKTYQVVWGGVNLFKFAVESTVPAPVLDTTITGYGEDYGTLRSDRIYYVPDGSGSFRVNNASTIDRLRYRIDIDNRVYSYSHAIGINSTNYLTNTIDIDDEWIDLDHNNVSQTVWDTYFEIVENIPPDVLDKLEYFANKGELQAKIFRVMAENYGSTTPTDRSYYIVEDDGYPEIQPETPLLDSIGSESSQSRRPELTVSISDVVAGVGNREDITVRYRKLQDEDGDGNLEVPTTKSQFNTTAYDIHRMEVIGLDAAEDTRESGAQEAVFVPYNEMGEGEYAVWVSAEDRAGNTSDDHPDGPFIFYLNIDQTEPRINNVSVNNKVVDLVSDTPHPVGADDLNLYFEGYGAQDLIYAVRYVEPGEETDWFIAKRGNIDYLTQYINRSFLDWDATGGVFENADGKAKDGPYEIFILVDEQDIYIDNDGDGEDDLTEALGEETGTGFFAPDSGIVNNYILSEEDSERRHVERFDVIVDNTPPIYIPDSLMYYESYPTSTVTLTPGDPVTIRKGTPVFQVQFENASEIRRQDVDIYFTNQSNTRRVAGEVVELTWDEENSIYTFDFAPVINLTPGNYNIEMSVTDVYDNIQEREFENAFEISTVAGGKFSFSIRDGARLNINESSALEIDLGDDPSLNPETLTVKINGDPVVYNGDIVDRTYVNDAGDLVIETRSDSYLENEEYYKAEGYRAEGYDVIFPDSNKRRVIIFCRLPLPTGTNKISAEVIDENGVQVLDSITFSMDSVRHGFGFGRLLIKN